MKKFFAILLSAIMLLSLVACASRDDGTKAVNQSTSVSKVSTSTSKTVEKETKEEAGFKGFGISNPQVGDVVTIGSFDMEYQEWPEITSDGVKEPLDWEIIKISDDGTRAMVLSKYIIAFSSYKHDNPEGGAATWEDSSLREWLNEDFFDEAFSANEKLGILETSVKNPNNITYGIEIAGGNDTKDKIYLLSVFEAEELFGSRDIPYQDSRLAFDYKGSVRSWWFRSPGIRCDYAATFNVKGGFDGEDVIETTVGVRPVMWISLK